MENELSLFPQTTLRVFIQFVKDIPTADIVSLLDYFTQPQADNKKPLAKLVFAELKESSKDVIISESDAIDLMCKRFLYVAVFHSLDR